MRLAMRGLFVLAIPGAVFGFLTRIPPPVFEPFGALFPDAGPDPLLFALVPAAAFVLVAAVFRALSSASRPDRPTRT
jgi:hypothetical protein